MMKTILITGSTDGIGLEAAKRLIEQGHTVLLHGRNPAKMARIQETLPETPGFVADLSRFADIEALAQAIHARGDGLDVVIHNAGVYRSAKTTEDGLDMRFMVNTIAPYLLTRRLLPLLGKTGRIINVSSAAQAAVDLRALAGEVRLSDHAAYAQSKHALNIWTRDLAARTSESGPVLVAVNPGSMLGTKMVKQAFGVSGADIGIGADILIRAALSDEFAGASGRYFDNDSGRFTPARPHTAADTRLVHAIHDVLERAGVSPA